VSVKAGTAGGGAIHRPGVHPEYTVRATVELLMHRELVV